MKKDVRAVLILLWWMLAPASVQAQISVPTVPPHAVRLDGVLDSAEWSAAAVLGDETVRIFVQQDEDHVLLGLRTAPLFVASVCLTRGRDVWVFHGSAAAGRARYIERSDVWELEEGFEWRLRDTSEGPATQPVLSAHVDELGWATNTVTTGSPGETEFLISKSLLGAGASRLAVGLLLAGDSPEVVGWPVSAGADGCTLRSTIAGPLEDELTFDLDEWEALEVGTPGGVTGNRQAAGHRSGRDQPGHPWEPQETSEVKRWRITESRTSRP